uniref:WD repeat-containing protein 37 n=1 Tax=Ascaris suum TaxID=6253 RepID=F1L2F1_ASCSU
MSSTRSEKHRIRSCTDSELLSANTPDNEQLAPPYRARLYQLFGNIEKEFDALYAQNCALRVKLNQLSERFGESLSIPADFLANANDASIARKESGRKAIQMGQKLKTALRVPPGRLVQSLKGGVSDSSRRFKYVRSFTGHRDGVWHVATSRGPQPILASASADQTCLLWSLDSGCCLAQYSGHCGSVNAVAFNPSSVDPIDLIVATASGDHTAHIWKASISAAGQNQLASSEEEEIPDREANNATEETATENEMSAVASIRQPLCRLTGHTGVVIAVDWITGGEQLITASWDRTANIYDAERGEILNVLSGHDDELNHCSAHLSQKLVVTASRDSTFRLWDFREPIHSVAVFQGHNDSVTSVVFSATDKLVSGSDDRSIKVWDLRNMRSAIATVRLDSATNRLSISRKNLVAIPHDNRNVRVYDLNSVRLSRLPRANGRSHRRMVCCATWADDHAINDLITCGFDKQIIAWKTSMGKE